MRDKQDRDATKYLISILSICCVGLIVLSALGADVAGPVRSVTSMVVVPVEKGISRFGGWLSQVTGNLSDTSSLREENEALAEQVEVLTAENSQLVLDKEELQRLRELLDLAEQYAEYTTVGAHVISKDTGNWYSNFTIDKGIADNIQIGCNVIAGSGLVGIVTSVGTNWAVVRSIIDDDSNVSAMVSTTSDTCIISGNLELIDTGSLSLLKLRDEDNKVHVGDKVVTSNISEKFLPGILIGYISELNNDANNLTKSGQITPVADFRHLQEVLVILERKQYVANEEGASFEEPVNDVAPSPEDETDDPDLLTAPRNE